jgi:pantoate--beta-alanine ligase
MRTFKTPKSMQKQALEWKRSGARVAFVPTMGYLHAGHISLVHQARRQVGADGIVVVSIYVNPTQFAPSEDLAKYPRDLKRDFQLCTDAGVDAIFLPGDEHMYPGRAEGLYSTYVVEELLTQGMEGTSRPTHFRGVTTIVAKLFNCVLPDVAVFGAKDWQQASVIRRMVDDLNFPVKIVVAPTAREPDGLAMSSRNVYLNPEQRLNALVLSQSIAHCRKAVAKRSVSASQLADEVKSTVDATPGARLDYVAFFDGNTLQPATSVKKGTHMALAVFFGKTRLIDNGRL